MKKTLLQQLLMASKYALIGVFLQTLLTGMLLASEIAAQETKSVREVYVTLKTNNHTVQEILGHIESETDYSFSYYKKEINLSKRIRITNLHQSVYDLLIEVSAKSGLSFRQINNVINVKNKAKGEKGEDVEIVKIALTVTGTVTSISDGTTLPGVNVLVKGTSIGTVTDVDGRYNINVPSEDDTLVFSSIGYINQEVAVNGRNSIDIRLAEDVQSLEEVVVVGYGTVKRTDLTSSVAQVSGEDIENRVVPRIDEALQGKLAGVTVQQTSGIPGAAPVIRIRGTSSITEGNQPLWVIDGMPIEDASVVANINLGDAEVLKSLKMQRQPPYMVQEGQMVLS